MDPRELAFTALRALLVYGVMLVVIRLLGKRTIGNFSAFDLLVALMLGEVVDEIIYGDVSIAQGMVAILVLAALEYANSWLSYGNDTANRWLEGLPTPLVADGALVREGMRKERMHENDVLAELRLQGIDDLGKVKRAMLETDGEVSVIRQDWAEPVEKGDLELDEEPEDDTEDMEEVAAAPAPRRRQGPRRPRRRKG
jgi:uncharacterized membrane protein YcaP (DUF421 family)